MVNGYIKVSRELLNNPWVNKDPEYLAVMIYLLKDAAFAEMQTIFCGKTITLKPGQIVTGRKKLASETRIDENKIKRILDAFESEHLIEQQKTNHGTLISLLFYDSDSESEQQNEQQLNSNRTATEQQLNTIRRTKEVKKEIKKEDVSKDTSKKVERSYSDNPELDRAIKDFLAYRKKVKKAEMTDRAIASMLKKLNEISADPNEQIKLLDYAMEHNWMTVYPIRGEPQGRAAPEPSYDDEQQRLAAENLERLIAEGSFRI